MRAQARQGKWVTKSPGAILNSDAGSQGGGQGARSKKAEFIRQYNEQFESIFNAVSANVAISR